MIGRAWDACGRTPWRCEIAATVRSSSVRRQVARRPWSRCRDLADDLVHQAVFLGLHGRQVAVALGVLGDPLDRLAGVLGEDLVDDLPALDDLLGLDLDVGDLAADLAVGLVDHDLGVRQGRTVGPWCRPPAGPPRPRRPGRCSRSRSGTR